MPEKTILNWLCCSQSGYRSYDWGTCMGSTDPAAESVCGASM